jgi:protein phosphatase
MHGGENMDKVAVIADIHGNIPALEAVLSDIKLRGIANIYCLGDLVGKGPHPDQVVDRIKAVCQEVVMGNWDLDMDKPTDKEDVSWTQGRLGPSRIQYLASLPFCHDFYMSGRLVRLLHASADSVYKRVQPWDSMEERLSMFRNTESTGSPHGDRTPHVVGYGDIHNAYIQHLRQKMLFNAGSVGNPLEMTQASYAILEGVYDCKETAAGDLIDHVEQYFPLNVVGISKHSVQPGNKGRLHLKSVHVRKNHTNRPVENLHFGNGFVMNPVEHLVGMGVHIKGTDHNGRDKNRDQIRQQKLCKQRFFQRYDLFQSL